jgi:hypothetical protein
MYVEYHNIYAQYLGHSLRVLHSLDTTLNNCFNVKNKIIKLDKISRVLGFWNLSTVWYSKKHTEEHNVSETGSVSVLR